MLAILLLVQAWETCAPKEAGLDRARLDELRAAKLLVQAVRGTELGVKDGRFTLNGTDTFLLGVSYYAGLGAPEDILKSDLAEMKSLGFNWLRVWATWAAFGNDVSAVDAEGKPRDEFLKRLVSLVAECDRRGLIVDVTLSRENGITGGPRLQTLEAHRRAVETVVGALKGRRNWFLDLSNERNVKDKRFTSIEDLKALREGARALDPKLLVTASHAGDIAQEELLEYVRTAGVDFVSPHRPRNAGSPGATAAMSTRYDLLMIPLGKRLPVLYQEPFRRGYGAWSPKAEDYLTDLKGARSGMSAAGWCFHNGDERARPEGKPRRCFDLREKGLFDQLDDEEKKFLRDLK